MLTYFRDKKQTAFIPFIVTGDPSLKVSEKTIDILVESGASIIELGVPFSDASADGVVIQTASERAAKKSGSLMPILDFASTIKKKYPQLGLVLFTYYNPILKIGLKRFASLVKDSKIDAVLTVDLPPEEATDYLLELKNASVGTVFLASPTTDKIRLPIIEKASTEFVYYVSRVGVTGAKAALTPSIVKELIDLRKVVSKPIAVGFGISNGIQAASLAPYVDGVVVGSAFVKIISETKDLETMCENIRALACDIVSGIRGASKHG